MIVAILLMAASQAAHRPATAPARPFDAVIKDAAGARDAGKAAEAIKLYREAVRRRPGFAEGWWWLGTLYYSQERWTDCRQSLGRFLALKADAGPAFAIRGMCDYKLKDYEGAIRDLNRAEALGLPPDDPNTAEARRYLVSALIRAENFERALAILAGLVQVGEPSPEIVTLAGIAALRKPIGPEELAPEDREVVIRFGRAIVTAMQRKAEEARQLFADVIGDFPTTPNIHYSYGAYLLSMDPDRAVEELKTELQRDPNHLPALVSLAMEYVRRGDGAQARTYAERAVAVGPKNFAAHACLGRALGESGDDQGAVRELEIAVKLAPDSPQALIALASAYAKVGRQEDAARMRAEFAKIKQIAPIAESKQPRP